MLTLENVSVRYGGALAVDDVSLHVGQGEWWMLTGPNGAGKSTLVSAVAQSVRYDGSIWVGNVDAKRLKPSERAKEIGVLSQINEVGYAFTVEEVASLGRYAYRGGLLGGADTRGEEAVRAALKDVGLYDMRKRSVLSLSGGERQRAFLAQAFAQDPKILLLDEPANHLDIMYQKQLFALIGRWLKQGGRAVISVVHDLSLAKLYGTHCALMHNGRVAARGGIGEALTRETLKDVYGMDVYEWMRATLAVWEDE